MCNAMEGPPLLSHSEPVNLPCSRGRYPFISLAGSTIYVLSVLGSNSRRLIGAIMHYPATISTRPRRSNPVGISWWYFFLNWACGYIMITPTFSISCFCLLMLDTISMIRFVYADRFTSFAMRSYSAACDKIVHYQFLKLQRSLWIFVRAYDQYCIYIKTVYFVVYESIA